MDNNSLTQDIGYIKAKIEDILENSARNSVRLDQIETQLSLYKSIYNAARFIGLALVAIMGLKFGDLSAIWKLIYGS